MFSFSSRGSRPSQRNIRVSTVESYVADAIAAGLAYDSHRLGVSDYEFSLIEAAVRVCTARIRETRSQTGGQQTDPGQKQNQEQRQEQGQGQEQKQKQEQEQEQEKGAGAGLDTVVEGVSVTVPVPTLSDVKALLPAAISFGQIRLAMAHFKRTAG